MKFIIDNKEIEFEAGKTILDAAIEGGVFIPHLCSYPGLEAKGGCRLCSVEIEGQDEPVCACETEAEDGMKINIYGDKANLIRKTSMELMLATHPAECTGCPKYGKCELQSMYQFMGVGPERWRKKSRTLPNDESNPLIQHLFTRCVRCGRCIRACRDLRGVEVLDYIEDDAGVHAGVPEGKSLKDAGCRFCGACIEVCPTGSIMDALDIMDEDTPYNDSILPCKAACPAHVNIPKYLRFIKDGEYEKAVGVIREKAPFPRTLGSICNHACETDCKRNHLGEPISICKLKYKATESDNGSWKENRVVKPSTGKKVAVIGAGPAGLTSAYYLAKQGHEVEVFEENEKAGGQCRYGIPAYRLPDEVLDKEIDDILEVGVKLHTSQPKTIPEELKSQGFDAVVVSTGTHQGSMLPLEGNDLDGVLLNSQFLKDVRMGNPPKLGDKVMVLGGGNVAYDCARTAIRLGAKEVHVACLESEDKMTSTPEEIKEGAEEGVILHPAFSFLRICGKDKVEGVEIQKIEKFYFDENRQPVMELVEGSNEVIDVDNVIFAVGQKPKGTEDMGLELTHGPYIQTDGKAKTSVDGVYAAGDVVTGTKSVIGAIEEGRMAASETDKYLGGDGNIDEVLVDEDNKNPHIGKIEGFADLERLNPDEKPASERANNFHTYEMPFTDDAATCEAGRCLQCDLRLDLPKVKLWNEF